MFLFDFGRMPLTLRLVDCETFIQFYTFLWKKKEFCYLNDGTITMYTCCKAWLRRCWNTRGREKWKSSVKDCNRQGSPGHYSQ